MDSETCVIFLHQETHTNLQVVCLNSAHMCVCRDIPMHLPQLKDVTSDEVTHLNSTLHQGTINTDIWAATIGHHFLFSRPASTLIHYVFTCISKHFNQVFDFKWCSRMRIPYEPTVVPTLLIKLNLLWKCCHSE